MEIIVAGFPSIRTQRTLANAEEAITEFDEKLHIACIEDFREMKNVGVIYTPSVLVNNKLKVAGRIPSVYEITTWVEKELEQVVN
jgi:protein-disulfide isomerase